LSSEDASLNESFILASGSEIRKKILSDQGFDFIVQKSEVDEEILKENYKNLPFEKRAIKLALAKAKEVSEAYRDKYVLGADQICVYKNNILNKPGNRENAVNSLKLLAGDTHYQYSGIALCLNGESLWSFCDTAILTMKALSEDEIKSYVDKDEPYQCAGSYKYESHGSKLFSDVKGSPFTIQGLALTPLLKALEDLDLYFKK
tara:strand:+ start:427 stop:1038 length:612 start_codon:yes stop_codon:yes gene_type:complete